MDDCCISFPFLDLYSYISFQPQGRDGGGALEGLSVRVCADQLPENVDLPLMSSSSQLSVCIPFTNLLGSKSFFGQGSANSIRQPRDLKGESYRK